MTTIKGLQTLTVETLTVSTSACNIPYGSLTFIFDQYIVTTDTVALPVILGMISQKVTTQLLNDHNFVE